MSEDFQELKLIRNGKQLSQADFIKSSDSMNQMQSIIEKLMGNTADLQKYIPSENVIKSQKSKYKISLQEIRENLNDKRKDIFKMLKTEITPNDTAQYLKEIEQKMQQIQQENQVLQKELDYKKDMFTKRELEYRKVIIKLQDDIKSQSLLNLNDGQELVEVAQTHQNILKVIGDIQKQTTKILIDQESDILRFFNNKINEIKKQFEEENIKEGKKDQDYVEKENQLIHELDWIKKIAQKIDNENYNLQKKHTDLKAQYKTQETDKKKLIMDLLMLKKENSILQNKIKEFESILNEVSQDNINQDISYNTSQFYQNNNNIQREERQNNNNNGTVKLPQITNNNNYQQNTQKKFNRIGNLKNKQNSTGNLNLINTGNSFSIIQRTEQEIQNVQNMLKNIQKDIRSEKIRYMNGLQKKYDIEQLLRLSIDDIKEKIIQLKGGKHVISGKSKHKSIDNQPTVDQQVEKLLNDEKTLTLIYDKAFHSDSKKFDNQVIENSTLQNASGIGSDKNDFDVSKISNKDI